MGKYRRTTHRKFLGINVIGHLEALATGLKYIFLPRATVKYPEVFQDFGSDYRGMLKLYMDRCISCSQCAKMCPSNAIKMVKEANADTMFGRQLTWQFLSNFFSNHAHPGLTYQRCIFCGFCVDICPVDALAMVQVHDTANYDPQEQVFKPEQLSLAPSVEENVPKVKPTFDEKRGLRYERL